MRNRGSLRLGDRTRDQGYGTYQTDPTSPPFRCHLRDFQRQTPALQLRQHDSLLRLVLAFAVGVAGFADLVGLEEKDLAQAFVGVDARRQRRGVRNLEGYEAFPLGLERGDVEDDAATSVGALAHADGQNVA